MQIYIYVAIVGIFELAVNGLSFDCDFLGLLFAECVQ